MVLLKATNEGNMIVIEIADDGKGIDVEAVKAKAVERGLISPNKLLTDVEAFNLIFEPGFPPPNRSPVSPAGGWALTWCAGRSTSSTEP
jgi:hypothetical protein